MAYTVALPDGRTVEFPDDVPKDKAAAIIRQQFPELGAPQTTMLGGAKELFKGLVPGAVGLVESAATGASALLPEDMEKSAREKIKSVAAAAKAPFAAAPGYEESIPRKLSESLGSFLPMVAAGPFGLAGRAVAAGLGVGAGAGEARTRAEESGATGEQRSTATALGVIPGAFEVFAPFRILGRLPDAAKAEGVILARRALQAGGEEAAQEALSGYAQNLIAKGVYKPEQELIEGLGEQAAYGGAVGAIAQGLLDLALGRRARGAAAAETQPDAGAAPVAPTPAGPSDTQLALPAPEEQAALPAPEERLALPNAPTPESIGEAIQERERLKSRPQTSDIAARVEELDALIDTYNQSDVEVLREEQAQQKAETAQAAADDAEVRTRFPGLVGAVENEGIAPGAFTMQNLVDTGVSMGPGVKSWAQANVVGKTTEDIQALVAKDPTLVNGKTQRAQLLRELLAPQPAPFEEKPSEPTPAPTPAVEQRDEPRAGEPSVGVLSEPAAPIVPEPGAGAPATAGEPVTPDGRGLVSAGRPAVSGDGAQGAQPAAVAKPVTIDPRMADRIEAVEARDEAREQAEYAAQRADMVAAFKDKHDRNIKAAWAAVQRARQAQKTADPKAYIAARDMDPDIYALEDALQRYDQFVNVETVSQKTLDILEETVNEIPQRIANLDTAISSAKPKAKPKAKAKPAAPPKTEAPKSVRENLQAIIDDASASKRSKQTAFAALDMLDDPDMNETAEDRAQNEAYAEKELQSAEKQRRFSTTKKAAKGQSLDSLKQEIAGAKGRAADALRRMIASGKVKLEESHPDGNKGGMFDGKTVTLYAQGIPEGQAMAVALHEVGAHMGMRNLLGKKQYNAVIDKIIDWMEKGGDSPQAKLAQAAYRRIPIRDIKNEDSAVARDEMVAYFVEELANAEATGKLPKLGPLRVLWNQIKMAVTTSVNKALGTSFGINDLTPQQIGAIAEAAMVRESTTDIATEGEVKQQFSVSAGTEKVADSMGPLEPVKLSGLKNLTQGFKAQGGVDYATNFRTQVADSAATIERRFHNDFDGAVRNKLGKVNPMGLYRQAQDYSKMLLEYFQVGTIAKEPTTGLWKVKADPKVRPPSDVYKLIDAWAAKNGYTRDRATFLASRILEGVRLDGMRASNKAGATNFKLHLDDAGIDQLMRDYKADPDLQAMNTLMDESRVAMVTNMEAAGRLTKEQAQEWRDVVGYVPFDRLDDDKFSAVFTKTKKISNRGLAQLGKLPELIGSEVRPVGNVFDNYINTLGWMVGQTMKTDATVQTLRSLERAGYAKYLGPNTLGKDNVVGSYVKGEMRYWEVASKYDVLAFKDLNPPKAKWLQVLGQASTILRRAVTSLPPFALKQVTDDVQRAIMTSGVKNPGALLRMTLSNFGGLALAELRGIQHPIVREFGALGLTGEYDFQEGKPAISLLQDLGYKPRGTFETLMHRLDGITRASDLAVRKAIYDQTMKESQGDQLLAQTRAREFINFRRRGASDFVGAMVTTIPFFNAYIQGMDVLYRAASGKDSSSSVGRAQARRMFWSRAAIAMTLSTLYALGKGDDDEDYNEMDLRTRDSNWILPGGYKLPVPTELGALFKVIPERIVEYMRRQGTPEEQTAWEATRTALAYIMEQYVGRTVPIPQAAKPLLEAWTNYSFFTGRELEGIYQKQQDPSMRRASNTSELAIAIANFSRDVVGVDAISPILVDNALSGYFGSTAGLLVATTDSLLNPTRVDRPLHKYALLSNYLYDPVGTRRMTEFYDEREKVGRANATLAELMKTDLDRAVEYAEKNADVLMMESAINSTLEQLERTRAYRKFLNGKDAAADMSAEEREAELKEIKQMEVELVGWVREAKTAIRQ